MMSARRLQAGYSKASLKYLGAEVESIMRNAPGKPPPPPPRKYKRNMKLELADAEIKKCTWCGIWSTELHCSFCSEHGYPTINDLGETV